MKIFLDTFFIFRLAAGHGPDDQKRLRPRRDRVGQRGIRRFVGQSCSQAKNRTNGRRWA